MHAAIWGNSSIELGTGTGAGCCFAPLQLCLKNFGGVMLCKLISVVGVSSLLIAAPLSAVSAAQAPPVSSWAGWYAGLNLGSSFGEAHDSATPAVATAQLLTGYQSLDGVIGGGQIGYNWQSGIWLVGLEADIQGSTEKSNLPAFDVIITRGGGGTLQVNEKLSWFDTVRGRLGVLATPKWLFYATGGLAYGGMQTNETLTAVTVFSNSFNSTRAGWTLGGGIEAKIDNNWTAKLEYLYLDFGTFNNLFVAPGVASSPITLNSRVFDNIVRIGLNYQFAAAPLSTSAYASAGMPVKAPPPPPVTSWTGFYLGINGGWGAGTTNHTDEFGITTNNFRTSGGLLGVTYGGNWQTGQFVLGFEGDFDFANINGTLTTAGPPLGLCSVNGGTTCFTNLNTFATDRVRAGVDVNGWLLFGTAGVGFGQVNAGQNPCGNTIFEGNSCNEVWQIGWVAGGGVEKMFAPHWSAKIEYLHYDFGTREAYTPALIGGGNTVSVLERGDIVRAGINYHF